MGVPREPAVQVDLKIVRLLRSWNGNIVEEDGRAVLTTECEGEMGTLGPFTLTCRRLHQIFDPGGFGKRS